MFTNRSISRIFSVLFNVTLMLTLLISSAAAPINAMAMDVDSDGDGIPDSSDNCPTVVNTDQLDNDGDGLGDVCDPFPFDLNNGNTDSDNDAWTVLDGDCDDGDSAAFPGNVEILDNVDNDCNGLVDDLPDGDGDADGISDSIDNCPLAANANQSDMDGDGLGDVCDPFPFDPNNGKNNSSLTIVKRASPNDGTDFPFNAEGPSLPPTTFTLDDEPGQPNDKVEHSITFNKLAAGSYTSGEKLPGGWVLEDVTCPGAEFKFDPKGSRVVVDIPAGADIICTFTNVNNEVGTITIIKDAQPDDEQDFWFKGDGTGLFSLDDDGDNTSGLSNQATFTLNPGTYGITEALPNGWSLDGIVCEGGKVQPKGAGIQFEIVAGSNITCTFTNVKEQGSIITVAANNASVTVNEGQTAANNGTASDSDGDPLTLTSSVGSVINNNDGTWSWTFGTSDGPDQTQTVTITADDGNGNTAQTTFSLTVNNVAPTLDPISVSQALVPVNTAINASASFADPGTLDTHTAVWDWGDGTTAGTVTQGAELGSVNDSHSYSTPGVYTIKLIVTDNDGAPSNESVYQFVVVYDPSAGFVTGGGWINSPAGAYVADPSLTGKANFGFVAKYKKGANVPDGNTEFQFKAGDLNFHSSSYQWLVVAGKKAQFKGEGTINGSGHYGFMLTAIDGQISGGGGVDKFRIKIWDMDKLDTVVYDNLMSGADDVDPTTALGGGSIVIHK